MPHLYDNRTLDPHTGTRQSLLRNSPVRRGKVGMIGYISGAKCCVGEDSFSGFLDRHFTEERAAASVLESVE